MKYASHINSKGMKSLAEQIKSAALDWDLDATASEIEDTNTFMEMKEGERCSVELRVKPGTAIFVYLEADEIEFEDLDIDNL